MPVGDQINSDDLNRWNVNEMMIDPISGMAMNYLAIYASANKKETKIKQNKDRNRSFSIVCGNFVDGISRRY